MHIVHAHSSRCRNEFWAHNLIFNIRYILRMLTSFENKAQNEKQI